MYEWDKEAHWEAGRIGNLRKTAEEAVLLVGKGGWIV